MHPRRQLGALLVCSGGALGLTLATRAHADDALIATSPPPIREEPISDPVAPQEPRSEHMAAFVHIGVQGQAVRVELPGAKLEGGGAVTVHGLVLGHSGAVSYRAGGSGALGGQTNGFVTHFEGDAALGPFVRFSDKLHAFVRVGALIDTHSDEELDTSVYSFPTLSTGLQFGAPGATFEIAPRGGAVLRALYAPGNEGEGRRQYRSEALALSWGGNAVLHVPIGFVDGSIDRIEQTGGLWLMRGRLCAATHGSPGLTVCGWAHHWKALTSGPVGTRDVEATALGFGIGFGESGGTGK